MFRFRWPWIRSKQTPEDAFIRALNEAIEALLHRIPYTDMAGGLMTMSRNVRGHSVFIVIGLGEYARPLLTAIEPLKSPDYDPPKSIPLDDLPPDQRSRG